MVSEIATAVLVALICWAYQAIKPPSPRKCGSPEGPPVTAPRVEPSDGRHIAYREIGLSKQEARYKIIVIHSVTETSSCLFLSPTSFFFIFILYLFGPVEHTVKDLYVYFNFQEFMEKLGLYILFFDRASYGESDPNPKRKIRSEALDIEELADKLQLGSKFYVIGFSIGTFPVWSCLKYIQHRHFFIYGFPFLQQGCILQGVYVSVYQDMMAANGKWEFDPMEITNPFPTNEGSVHMWQGGEDKIAAVPLNRYISEKLPWIRYHEIPDGGHFIFQDEETCEAIFKSVLFV
ncbi:hypothetical protein RJ639_009580 [Escallonia herrerae]|uniref:AB hydrolase-1 domain-containing protein n=1 Tax=Escallonia herrerae TaxID=1293975 RepID=A0AA88VT49_9ASTE|nr:hypothetical protein RJ639_009580 [Escallonia herrerae]